MSLIVPHRRRHFGEPSTKDRQRLMDELLGLGFKFFDLAGKTFAELKAMQSRSTSAMRPKSTNEWASWGGTQRR